MTAKELKHHFDDKFGLVAEWPKTYEVDHETYANCCQFIFELKVPFYEKGQPIKISLGENNGIMFRGVELTMKKT